VFRQRQPCEGACCGSLTFGAGCILADHVESVARIVKQGLAHVGSGSRLTTASKPFSPTPLGSSRGRFFSCRGDDIEQRFDHFGGEHVLLKLWILPWCPGTARHHSPVTLGDRCFLESYLVHAIDDCSLSCSNPKFLGFEYRHIGDIDPMNHQRYCLRRRERAS